MLVGFFFLFKFQTFISDHVYVCLCVCARLCACSRVYPHTGHAHICVQKLEDSLWCCSSADVRFLFLLTHLFVLLVLSVSVSIGLKFAD